MRNAAINFLRSNLYVAAAAGIALIGYLGFRAVTFLQKNKQEIIGRIDWYAYSVLSRCNINNEYVRTRRTFLCEIVEWSNDNSVTGNKDHAAERMLRAFFCKSSLLEISFLGLSSMPKCIRFLTQLTAVDASSNELKELPKEIGNLINLKYLDLGRNKLTILPKEIGSLSKLVSLRVNENRLEDLPNEISHLKQLSQLDIIYNQKLTRIPKCPSSLQSISFWGTGISLDDTEAFWHERNSQQIRIMTTID